MQEMTATGAGLHGLAHEKRGGTPQVGPEPALSEGLSALRSPILRSDRTPPESLPKGLSPGACHVTWLGRDVDYLEASELQRRLVDLRAEGHIPDTLLLLEHPPVYTAGRRSQPGHVLLDAGGLRELGVPLIETDRGGQVTYHGPGQLVGYLILSLTERGMGPRAYVCALEQVLVATLADFGITAGTDDDHPTGVWVGGAKVAAIGVKVSRGVTMHGFALNVDPDLGYFRYIVPCGIRDREVTSMARLLGRAVAVDDVRRSLVRHFGSAFQARVVDRPWPKLLSVNVR